MMTDASVIFDGFMKTNMSGGKILFICFLTRKRLIFKQDPNGAEFVSSAFTAASLFRTTKAKETFSECQNLKHGHLSSQ